jgi:hypothetical protein
MKKVLLLFAFYFLLSAFSVQAALVPCGTSDTPACTWCHLMQLVKNVIDFMMYIVFPLAAVMIVVGGIMIMTAGGSTERVAKGREIITAAITGLIIALLSWLLLDTIIKIMAPNFQAASLGPWNKIKCN